jgi:hypothetical protein
MLTASFIGCASSPAPVDANGRPLIIKLGTIDVDIVESTPIVFHNKLYRFQWIRGGRDLADAPDGDWSKAGYFRFLDIKNNRTTPVFAKGHSFGSAYVDGDTVYVTGTSTEKGWAGQRVQIFASNNLKDWEEWTALDLDGFGICNTSMTKADDQYVLMFEIFEPKEQAGVQFTARFAFSKDLKNWEVTPPECVYAKDRYTAPHCLRYLDGYYYNFYLEAVRGNVDYQTYVVRSKDLIYWEPSPLNPVLRASEEDRKILNPALTEEQRERIAVADDWNNSDIDFCEYKGKLRISYSWGNQQGIEFLANAEYDGTLEEFLRGWFPEEIGH